MNIGDWRVCTAIIDSGYANQPVAAILDMQISWFSNLNRIIHQRVFRKKIAKTGQILATGERLRQQQ